MSRVKKVHDLPTAPARDGLLPDAEPRFGPVLAQALMDASTPKPVVGDAPMRFSDAGTCARALALAAIDAEREPMDLSGHHVTNMGTLVHEAWQAALGEVYGDRITFEVSATIHDEDGRLLAGGSCDGLLVEDDGTRTLLELKTVGGFAYKMQVGERGRAEGPKNEAIIQAALNARAHDADRIVLVSLARDAISKGLAERKGFDEVTRFSAEWTFTREQLDEVADLELKRVGRVLDLLDDGLLAPRHLPDMPQGARIVDTERGRWELRDGDAVVDTGSTWWCGYCPFQPTCRTQGADEHPIADGAMTLDLGGAA